MDKYYLAIYGGALLTVIAQLFLKKGAGVKKKGLMNFLLNRYVIVGYFLFFAVTLLNLFALKKVLLIEMVIINPIIQILVVLFSILIFKEKLSRNQIFGILIIILGIVVFNLNF